MCFKNSQSISFFTLVKQLFNHNILMKLVRKFFDKFLLIWRRKLFECLHDIIIICMPLLGAMVDGTDKKVLQFLRLGNPQV